MPCSLIAFIQQKLCKVGPVLPGYAHSAPFFTREKDTIRPIFDRIRQRTGSEMPPLPTQFT
jgi:hypothetical protein